MAIDWANDHFVRVFTRDTDEDLLLSWEARAIWHEMLRKCDQSGLITTKRGVRGLAALIRVPLEVVERVLQELLEDGRIRSVPSVGFVVPNYEDAQFTPRSDRSRKADSRTRRRQAALTAGNHTTADNDGSRDVTSGHAESREVTHNITDTDTDTSHHSAAPQRDGLADLFGKCDAASEPSPPKRRKRELHQIPEDWMPRSEERALADELGLDCDHEAREFLTYWLGEGRPKKNWDQTFANRLLQQSKRGRRYATEQPRTIPEL